ncbi:MAG: FAD-dependent oxidoreductase [Novosphingobium sp.]
MSFDYDVIVVGGGAAGMCAAIEAHLAGAKVMILEADTKLGGATALSGGVFYAADTSVQRARGYADSADAMFDYVMTLNQWRVKPDLFRIICDGSGPCLEWLIELGAVFPPEQLVKGGVETVPRAHPSAGAGSGIADVLINRVGALSIETALATRVERLLVEDGRVVGIHALGMDLRAPTVIVTTGGFGNSAEMRARFFPTAAQHGDRVWAVHDPAPFILGDGITLGEAVGAAITGHDTGLLLPSSGHGRNLEPFMPPWLMLVNIEARRFIPEMASYSITGYALNEQSEARGWAIFDEAALLTASHDIRYLDPYGAGINLPTWEEDTIRKRVAKGEILVAQTLDELAGLCGLDPRALAYSVEQYNADCDARRDTHFFQDEEKAFPVRTGPFYACDVRASTIGVTGAGLDIDRDCRVLDEAGVPIPGLYAAGEVLGVLMGKRYAGGGMSIGPAVVLGREAGRRAAALVQTA